MSIADDLETSVRSEYGARIQRTPTVGSFIQVLGSSSSGKTTAIKSFIERRPNWRHVYDSAFLQDERFKHYHEQLFLRREPSYYLAFQTEALLIRFLQNSSVGANAICDQSMHSIWAYSRVLVQNGLLSEFAYQTFFASFLTLRSFSELPSLVVRFTCAAQTARERVISRARAHEQSAYTVEFLAELDEAYRRVVGDYSGSAQVHTIDTSTLTADQAVHELEAVIDAHQGRRG